jgi:hypothetical protein
VRHKGIEQILVLLGGLHKTMQLAEDVRAVFVVAIGRARHAKDREAAFEPLVLEE